jgi:hypothetical protein
MIIALSMHIGRRSQGGRRLVFSSLDDIARTVRAVEAADLSRRIQEVRAAPATPDEVGLVALDPAGTSRISAISHR